MAPGSRHSVRHSLRKPMPMIVEDDGSAPPMVPPRSPRRLPTNSGMTDYTMYSISSLHSRESSVPDRTPGPEPRPTVWNQAEIVRRGGWYRLGFMAFIMIAIVVGLAAGLTVGLRKNNLMEPQPQLPTSLFPAGSYSFITALANVSTACTNVPTTFRCFPFATYSPSSPNTAAATFSWIITPVTAYSYTISSSANPFAPSFANLSLEMLDANQESERLVFNFTMVKDVVPSAPLPGADATASCWFNSTVMTATLWTRERASYPVNITAVADPRNASSTFAPWPYRVDVRQVQAPSPGVPDCRNGQGQPIGDFHVEPAATGDDSCQCVYMNYELTQSNVTRTAAIKRVK